MVTIEEWQMLSCLEVSPTLLDPGELWVYNQSTYRVVQGDIALELSIIPSSNDLRVTVRYRQIDLYDLSILGVKDVRYRRQADGEHVEIVLDDRNVIDLMVKPHIRLLHST